MPNKALVLNFIGIILQYSLLILIYYFLFRVIKMVATDLIKPKQGAAIGSKSNNESAIDYKGKLTIVDSGHLTLAQTIFILGETSSIGRNEHNEIIIDDAFVSYEHANINRNKQGYWLTDLNSTNKTYLNRQPITERVLLKNGDTIKIGAVTFRFEG
ncbi:MAG: FHA domain-containing protein [Sporomusaceae bacterium]|nr:FHA domain-containing protein [Sporomusaceae bacterium]